MQWLIDLVIEAIGIPPTYIWRGEWGTYDFTQATLIQDNAWHELDLSAIVPEGATAVNLHGKGVSNAVNVILRLRKGGQTTSTGTCFLRSQVATVTIGINPCIAVGADRKIEYWVAGGVFTGLTLTVHGWWL